MNTSSNRLSKRWSPELRRAMMRVRPEFFGWPMEQQTRYGIDMPEDDEARLDQALLMDLFGLSFDTPKKARRASADLPLAQLDRWNAARLPLLGIGEDNFFLNGFIPGNGSLLDFGSVRDYDQAQHDYQERARKDEFPEYVVKPYRGQLYLDHAWLYVDDRFAYGVLSMAAGYIYSVLEGAVHDAVKACIPYRYVPGRDHGAEGEGGSFLWDMRKDADGQELLVDELEYLAIHHTMARYDSLRERWHGQDRGAVFMFPSREQKPPDENQIEFVFSDTTALEKVRFSSFVRDCRAISQSPDELFRETAEEEAALQAWVRAQHQHLLKTFDPTNRPSRERKKVYMSAKAVADLERMAEDCPENDGRPEADK